jgi:CheY-like chemotaxis protein
MKAARVLIVEDESQLLEVMSRLLEQRGHSVAGAGSAEEGQRRLAESSFDAVLLDQVLPGVTGTEALRRLVGAGRGAPVYLMSGFTGDELREDARLLGAAGFVSKPIDFPSLYALLDALPERRP